MKLTVTHDFLPKRSSAHAALVMDHFGVDFQTSPHVIAEEFDLPIEPGDVVCFTGESGSGKSSLMRAAAGQLEDVLDADSLDLGQDILVDALPLPFAEGLALLSLCGLGEARLLLRTPGELSEGERYRFRLALALSRNLRWILADEFTAPLDRTLARVVAYNLRRAAARTGIGLLLATAHADVVDDLAPSLHVACHLDGRIEVHRSPPCRGGSKKKTASAFNTNSKSPPPPSRTGRISLGGITAAGTSAAPAL